MQAAATATKGIGAGVATVANYYPAVGSSAGNALWRDPAHISWETNVAGLNGMTLCAAPAKSFSFAGDSLFGDNG